LVEDGNPVMPRLIGLQDNVATHLVHLGITPISAKKRREFAAVKIAGIFTRALRGAPSAGAPGREQAGQSKMP